MTYIMYSVQTREEEQTFLACRNNPYNTILMKQNFYILLFPDTQKKIFTTTVHVHVHNYTILQ